MPFYPYPWTRRHWRGAAAATVAILLPAAVVFAVLPVAVGWVAALGWVLLAAVVVALASKTLGDWTVDVWLVPVMWPLAIFGGVARLIYDRQARGPRRRSISAG